MDNQVKIQSIQEVPQVEQVDPKKFDFEVWKKNMIGQTMGASRPSFGIRPSKGTFTKKFADERQKNKAWRKKMGLK